MAGHDRESRWTRDPGREYFDRDRQDFDWREDRPEPERRFGDGSEQGYGTDPSFWRGERWRDSGFGAGGPERWGGREPGYGGQGAWGTQAGWGGSSEGWSGQGGYGGYRSQDWGGHGGFSEYRGQNWGGPVSYGEHYRRLEEEPQGFERGYGGGLGRFAGRGPKNWKRSDERIREDVSERLSDHPDIDASNIEVQVQDGMVTLAGHVEERHTRRMAEDVASSCSGVKDVLNRLRVERRKDEQGGDEWFKTPKMGQFAGSHFGQT